MVERKRYSPPELNLPCIDKIDGRIIGVGIDIVQNDRIGRMFEKHGDRFLERCLTESEISWCRNRPDPVEAIAVRWAAKEACYKGINGRKGMGLGWKEFEVALDQEKVPYIRLGKLAGRYAASQGINRVFLSLTHEKGFSAAIVIMTRQG